MVYVGIVGGVIHHGHTRIIAEAAKYGPVIIGLLTDTAVRGERDLPLLSFGERAEILLGFKGVDSVVPQDDWSYANNIRKYKPKFMVHGDDWAGSSLRNEAIEALAEVGGNLVEVEFTSGIDEPRLVLEGSNQIFNAARRQNYLRRLLGLRRKVRIIEAHSPLSALIVDRLHEIVDGRRETFDGYWSSSLTDSALQGLPDNEILDFPTRFGVVARILDVVAKPLVMDIDTGGQIAHLGSRLKQADRLGISAVIMEDKTGLKRNSLFGNDVPQTLAEPNDFAQKIDVGKKAIGDSPMMLIARLESLILEAGMEDALKRALLYVEAGADGIMIHSRQPTADEVIEFAARFRAVNKDIPLVCVPSSYSTTHETALEDAGFNMIIYANQLLRSVIPAMEATARSILKHGRSFEAEKSLVSVAEMISFIPSDFSD